MQGEQFKHVQKRKKQRKENQQKKRGGWRNVPKETAAIHWNINGLVGWLMLGQQERPQIWQKTVLTWLNRDPVASVPTPVIVNTCSFKTPGFFRTQVSYRWETKHFRAVQKVIKPRRFQVHITRGGGGDLSTGAVFLSGDWSLHCLLGGE